jgi:hypothetical protein
MPQKMAGSDPLPPFGASTVTEVVRATSLYCQNEEKAQKCTRNRESSGESWLNEVLRLALKEKEGNQMNQLLQVFKDYGGKILLGFAALVLLVGGGTAFWLLGRMVAATEAGSLPLLAIG